MRILQNGVKNSLRRCHLRVSATHKSHRHRLRSFLLLIKASCSVVLRALYEAVILSRSPNAAALDSCLFDFFVGHNQPSNFEKSNLSRSKQAIISSIISVVSSENIHVTPRNMPYISISLPTDQQG